MLPWAPKLRKFTSTYHREINACAYPSGLNTAEFWEELGNGRSQLKTKRRLAARDSDAHRAKASVAAWLRSRILGVRMPNGLLHSQYQVHSVQDELSLRGRTRSYFPADVSTSLYSSNLLHPRAVAPLRFDIHQSISLLTLGKTTLPERSREKPRPLSAPTSDPRWRPSRGLQRGKNRRRVLGGTGGVRKVGDLTTCFLPSCQRHSDPSLSQCQPSLRRTASPRHSPTRKRSPSSLFRLSRTPSTSIFGPSR